MSLVSGNSSPVAMDKEVTVDSISRSSGQYSSPPSNDESMSDVHDLMAFNTAWAPSKFNFESISVVAGQPSFVNIDRSAGKHNIVPQVDSALANPAIAMAVEPTAEQQQQLKCPRCDSTNTKFCYYHNYNLTQPRHFCKSCRRYWTKGGALRNIPVGGGTKRSSNNTDSSDPKRPTPDPSPVLKPPVSALYPPPIEAADDKMLEIYTSPGQPSCMNIDRSAGKHNSVPLVDRALSNAADLGGAAYAGSGTLRNGFTRNKAPLSPTIGTPTEQLESFDVEVQIDEQETDFQRNALLVSGTAFLAVGGTVISAALTANYENKSGHFKALAKFLSISSIGLGLSGIMVVILAFRRGHRHLQLASSICYTSGLVTVAILVAFGILAVIGI